MSHRSNVRELRSLEDPACSSGASDCCPCAAIYPTTSARSSRIDRLQYGLVDHAQALRWSSDRVLVIDDNLGKSGATEGREGFQRLVAEVNLNRVGLIVGIEMSRLARSSKDWHQLSEVCALFRTLIADLDGIYDPS